MPDSIEQFEKRKQDHIELALLPENQASEVNPFDQLILIHEALPDLNFNEIDISGQRFHKAIKTPFFVSSMTAGHKNALKINKNLIEGCAQTGWAMGVGSQRREIFDKEAGFEWKDLRQNHPDVSLYSNIGIAQIINTPIQTLVNLTQALQAQALIVHCNALQECIQPEGTPEFKGIWHALEQLIKHLNLPVVVKETGCGFAKSTLKRLNDLGVAAVDISGLGGTHWGRIEGHRAINDNKKQKAALSFANWGIDTITSVISAASLYPKFEIWGSGGVRNGLDAAKLIALGATSIGFAKLMLEAALESSKKVVELMTAIEYELKVAMFCTGSKTLSDLKEKACL